jgi:hypothetical protein
VFLASKVRRSVVALVAVARRRRSSLVADPASLVAVADPASLVAVADPASLVAVADPASPVAVRDSRLPPTTARMVHRTIGGDSWCSPLSVSILEEFCVGCA